MDNIQKIQLTYHNGQYYAPIDITVDEWKEMLQCPSVFEPKVIEMLKDWYAFPGHEATSKEIIAKRNLKHTPFNAWVVGLGHRIIKYLNRFEIVQCHGSGKSFWIIPFEGWHKGYTPSGHFVWKIRDELAEAMETLGIVDSVQESKNVHEMLESYSVRHSKEGQKKLYYTTKYERKPGNRAAAIRIHGCKCSICGFNFEKTYGPLGAGFIEVHHVKPLYSLDEEIEINPHEDLICVCSNCHRMLHRHKTDTLTPETLRQMLKAAH